MPRGSCSGSSAVTRRSRRSEFPRREEFARRGRPSVELQNPRPGPAGHSLRARASDGALEGLALEDARRRRTSGRRSTGRALSRSMRPQLARTAAEADACARAEAAAGTARAPERCADRSPADVQRRDSRAGRRARDPRRRPYARRRPAGRRKIVRTNLNDLADASRRRPAETRAPGGRRASSSRARPRGRASEDHPTPARRRCESRGRRGSRRRRPDSRWRSRRLPLAPWRPR